MATKTVKMAAAEKEEAKPTKMAAEKEEPKVFSWKWVWSDHGDTILTSHQWFPTKSFCTIDGFRHSPCLQRRDTSGRTGFPRLHIRESPVQEYRWVAEIFDKKGHRLEHMPTSSGMQP